MVGVGANTYVCNVSDANGCTTSQSVTISQPQALVMAASSFSNVSCFEDQTDKFQQPFKEEHRFMDIHGRQHRHQEVL